MVIGGDRQTGEVAIRGGNGDRRHPVGTTVDRLLEVAVGDSEQRILGCRIGRGKHLPDVLIIHTTDHGRPGHAVIGGLEDAGVVVVAQLLPAPPLGGGVHGVVAGECGREYQVAPVDPFQRGTDQAPGVAAV